LLYRRSAELARSFKNTVFEDGGVQNISRIKIYRTTIIVDIFSRNEHRRYRFIFQENLNSF